MRSLCLLALMLAACAVSLPSTEATSVVLRTQGIMDQTCAEIAAANKWLCPRSVEATTSASGCAQSCGKAFTPCYEIEDRRCFCCVNNNYTP